MITKSPVAYFANLKSRKAQNRSISSILVEIQNGTHAKRIAAMRQAQGENRDNLKRQLPCFMASGTSTGSHKAADFLDHSGLLQVDVDDVGEERAAELRDELGHDPHIFAAFVSPSGSGVKALIRIPADKDRHLAAFGAVAEYLRSKYAVEVDMKCKDISRVCFVSDDPELVLNADAVELDVAGSPLPDCEKEVERGRRHTSTLANSSEFLNTESSVLCNITEKHYVLCNITEKQLGDDLLKHYRKSVARFYDKPQLGTRNKTIVEITAKLFFELAPEAVRLLLAFYRRENTAAFSDYPVKEYWREVESVIAGSEESYLTREGLTSSELEIYQSLTPPKQCAFRICRSLSRLESDDGCPPPLFYMSCAQLEMRIVETRMMAWRILHEFEERKIIEKITNGAKWASGIKPSASVWRWIL